MWPYSIYIYINTASVFLCQIDTASQLENVEREFIKMVLLAKLQPLLGIFEFCAFILRHQSAIDAKVVGLVFDNNTAQLANHISITLSGCEQKCFNTDLTNIKFVGLDCDLIIQFGVQNSKYIAKRSLKARSIILLMSDEPIPLVNILPRVPDYVSINYNELVVNLHHNPITFITSTFKSWRLAHIKATSEVELVRSFDWLAFLCHVKKLPTGEFLRVFDDSFEDSNGLANNVLHPSQPHPKTDNRIAFISGFNVGMYKIIAERLSSNLLIIQNLVSEADYNQRFSRLPSTNLQDHRLSWRYWKYRRPVSKFTISLTSPHAVAIYTFARAKRYRILVPRIVLESSSANNMFMTLRKCGVILGILLVTGIFVALRLFCQWTVTKLSRHYGSSYLVHSFFDTFSQLLGISSSDSLREASSSECQLLIVVGVFAILSSGIFSGVLYEDQFIEHKLSFKYNSLDDICREGLDVGVPLEWYLYFKMEN